MAEPSYDINTLLKKLTSGTIREEERNALEEIAREDPFVKEAMEGYLQRSTDQSKNLAELEALIREKSRHKKSTGNYLSWRMAAAILLVIGTVSVIYFLNSLNLMQPNQGAAVFQAEEQSEYAYDPESKEGEIPTAEPPAPQDIAETAENPTRGSENSRSRQSASSPVDLAKSSDAKRNQIITNRETMAEGKSIPLLEGRIFDDIGNPLIGAKIYLNEKDTAIYTDFDGRFVLNTDDSTDRLTISYIGFEPKQIEHPAPEQLESIILMENQTTLEEVVNRSLGKPDVGASYRKSNSDFAAEENLAVSSIPVNGWPRYYAYIEQNKKIPSAAKKSKVSGEVQLQFSIDQSGRPQNIFVEKSLGYGCDQEAIRLVQEGPDWMENPSNKTTITILSIHF